MRAVLTADFAIGEFQVLDKLLFVHGRQNYVRISNMILYFFYKNMIFTIPQFFFGFINGFSGQSAFEAYYISFYNMCFTAAPLIVTATFDWDINYKSLVTTQYLFSTKTKRKTISKFMNLPSKLCPNSTLLDNKNKFSNSKTFLSMLYKELFTL
jgi:magnesium-transporting ATPase (P-type)